jgi:hypothetical protein
VSNGDEPAAPCNIFSGYDTSQYTGFTKREVIAKDCLVGILSNTTPTQSQEQLDRIFKIVPIIAVKLADALLSALAKP